MSTNVQLIASLRTFCCQYDQKPALEILKRTTIKEFFCHQKVGRITQTQDENGDTLQIIDGQKQELIEKKVYFLSSRNVKPGNYLATGYIKTHPKTQAITFLIETLVPQEDDYQAFDLKKNLHHLNAYLLSMLCNMVITRIQYELIIVTLVIKSMNIMHGWAERNVINSILPGICGTGLRWR